MKQQQGLNGWVSTESWELHYKVEQGLGTMKRKFGLSRARYFGVRKTEAQMIWEAINLNLLKAANKIKALGSPPPPLMQ